MYESALKTLYAVRDKKQVAIYITEKEEEGKVLLNIEKQLQCSILSLKKTCFLARF